MLLFIALMLLIILAILYHFYVIIPVRYEQAKAKEKAMQKEEELDAVDRLLNGALSEAGGYDHK